MISPQDLHRWNVSPAEAIAIQEQLRHRIIRQDNVGKVNRIAGVDVGFEMGGAITRAAVAVISFPELELMDRSIARCPTVFPYVPGLLSFREAPAILEALKSLQTLPDLLMVDGQGLAHPRRFGLASHLGLLVEIPSIGVAKSILVGRHQPLDETEGTWAPLVDGGEVIGAALRTRQGVKPVYVSIGHRISLETAVGITMQCVRKHRLPEPTRQADLLASNR
ncbi:MAG: deoxyribonuclease V [Anaerolineales bacterium]|nr:deoxyribonuclease V [Anaerolineales bacterium]